VRPLERTISLDTEIPIDEEPKHYKVLVRLNYSGQLSRQAMYVENNGEDVRATICYRGKAISIIYFECVFVALCIQHAMPMCHTVISGQSGSTTFLHIISKKA